MDFALELARTIRLWLYQLSSATWRGIEIDIVLHLVLGALIFAVLERRLGAGRAAWWLAGLIVGKEIGDIFLKSRLEYIQGPTPAVVTDIALDMLTGGLGGLAVWLAGRLRRRPLSS